MTEMDSFTLNNINGFIDGLNELTQTTGIRISGDYLWNDQEILLPISYNELADGAIDYVVRSSN